MKKTIKRTLAIVMAVAMLFALSATAFATGETNTVTVYLRMQTADVPEVWDFTLGTLNNVSYITGSADSNYFIPVTVTKAGTIYVKDVIEALSESPNNYNFTLVTCSNHDSHGCIHSDTVQTGETACSCTTCNCTWARVEDYYNPGIYDSALNSICFNGVTRSNNSYIDTEGYEEGHGYYEGTSWEYFVANNSTASAVYSQTAYMDQYSVNSSMYITLSFDTSSFEW